MITPFMHLGTEDGDVEIREKDLDITDAELKRLKLRITRKELRRCFAEAMELMKGATQEDWARHRPVCDNFDGKWVVVGLVGYNQNTHPLMKADYSGPKGTG